MDNIKEIVDGIAEAEREAHDLMQAALNDAKTANLDAEAEAQRLVAEAKVKVKEERRAVAAEAERDADVAYEKTIGEGLRQAEAIEAHADTSAAEKAIIEAFTAKYVGR